MVRDVDQVPGQAINVLVPLGEANNVLHILPMCAADLQIVEDAGTCLQAHIEVRCSSVPDDVTLVAVLHIRLVVYF